jgi:hypothetical protein
MKTVIINPNGEIHKVNLVAQRAEFPFDFVDWAVVDRSLEGFPSLLICTCIGDGADSKNVVNKATVESQVGLELWNDSLFTESKLQCSPRRCRQCSHSRTGQLLPSSIWESEDIILHDEAECFHEGLDGNARKAFPSEVGSNEKESTIRWDVSVHQDGIGNEQR